MLEKYNHLLRCSSASQTVMNQDSSLLFINRSYTKGYLFHKCQTNYQRSTHSIFFCVCVLFLPLSYREFNLKPLFLWKSFPLVDDAGQGSFQNLYIYKINPL